MITVYDNLQVKNGARTLTVDLTEGKCDCRVFDLTGIPCEHAVAAIHRRREQPVNYVSKYYSREMYLESYKIPLAALKGEEFWEIHSTDEMLPPFVTKKLRGRPKKQRGGMVMHCSICKEAGHRRNQCPKRGEQGNERAHEASQQGGNEGAQEAGQQGGNEGAQRTNAETQGKAPPRRSKLMVRKKEKGIHIKEPCPTTQAKVTDSSDAPITGKGKEKMQPKTKHTKPYLSQITAETTQSSQTSKSAAASSQCLTGSEGKKFMKDLRGPLYNEWLLRWPPIKRPSEATTGSQHAEEEEDAELPLDEEEDGPEEQTSTQPRRSVRLIAKTQFKFTNTPETAVDVDEDDP